MVGKLIKHEALRTRGMLLTIFGAALLLSVVGALTAATRWPVISQTGFIISMVGTVGVLPVTQLALAVDYWQTGYRRVGYFTQTLPVKGSTIFWSRMVWAVVVVIVSTLWALVLAGITLMGNAHTLGYGPLEAFGMVGNWWASVVAVMPWWGWVVAPLALLVLAMFSLVQYYFAASVGSERRFNSLGAFGPVAVWFLLYIALQVVLMAFMVIPVGLGVVDGSLGLVFDNYLQMMLTNTDPGSVPIGFLPGFLLSTAVLLWRTAVSWNKKVSLV